MGVERVPLIPKSIQASVFIKSGLDLKNNDAIGRLYGELHAAFLTVSEVPGVGIAYRNSKEMIVIQKGRVDVSWRKVEAADDLLPRVEELASQILAAFGVCSEPDGIGFDAEYTLSLGHKPNMSRLVSIKGDSPVIIPSFFGGTVKREGRTVTVGIDGTGADYRLNLMQVTKGRIGLNWTQLCQKTLSTLETTSPNWMRWNDGKGRGDSAFFA
jgi:hypothetical protein